MYNGPKQSNSTSNVRSDNKKSQHNQGSKNGNYRKENRYEEYEDEREQYHYKQKGHNNNNNYTNKKGNNQGQYQSKDEYMSNSANNNSNNHNQNNNNKKSTNNVTKRYTSNNESSYFIEYKGKQIQLGSTWKEMIHEIDKYFGKNDMVFNLALKINVWDQLKDNSEVVVPKKDIDDILELYGKYRDRGY